MATLFYSYSHKDETYRDLLETHLTMLRRQGIITSWHDRRLKAGDEIDAGIDAAMREAKVILLLVSPDFLASEYCYGVEVAHAMERHRASTARVIPIILRPCEWQEAPFGGLLAAPKDGLPVSKFTDRDDAFLNIAQMIRAAVSEKTPKQPAPVQKAAAVISGPRSNNLKTKKTFTEQDRDLFQEEGYEFMSQFFMNSLKALEDTTPGVMTRFKPIDATRFTAVIYKDGKSVAKCQIRVGSGWGGISYSNDPNSQSNSMNENLRVEVEDGELFFKPMGVGFFGPTKQALSASEAAEYYWSILIRSLQ